MSMPERRFHKFDICIDRILPSFLGHERTTCSASDVEGSNNAFTMNALVLINTARYYADWGARRSNRTTFRHPFMLYLLAAR